MNPSFLSSLNISASTVAWIIFIFALLIWFGISAILLYHWRTYGRNNKMIALAESTYLLVSLVIMGGAFVSILYM